MYLYLIPFSNYFFQKNGSSDIGKYIDDRHHEMDSEKQFSNSALVNVLHKVSVD